jgi:hypothetical protein
MKRNKKFLKYFISNKEGIAVLQVLIAAAMVAVVSVGIVQTMKTSTQMTKKVAQDFEVKRIVNNMESILKDSSVCRSTFYGMQPAGKGLDFGGGAQSITAIVLRNNIDSINTWEGATSDIDASEYSAHRALPIKSTFLRADCPETGTPPDYPEQAPCIIGKGTASMVLVKSINILAYESTHPQAGMANSPFKNETNQATVELVVKKGIAIGKDVGTLSASDKEKLTAVSFGSLEIPVRFPILVSLDTRGRITSCAVQLKNYFDQICEDMFDGVVDKTGNLKCKNITLYNVTSPSTPTALVSDGDLKILAQAPHGALPIVQRGDQIVTKRVVVGTDPLGTTNAGSIGIGGDATIKGDVTLTNGQVYFGPLSGTPPLGQKTKMQATVDRELIISGVGGPSSTAEGVLKLGSGTLIQGKNSRVGINNTNPSVTLDVTGTAGTSGNLTVNGNTYAKAQLLIGDTVKATFKIVGGKLVITGANVEIVSGKNDQWETSQTSTSLYQDLAAKRGWVWRLFQTRLGSTDAKNGVIDAILNAGGSAALGDLRSQVCAKMRRGSGITASWNGTTCDLTVNALCGVNQGLYGFDANGNKLCRNESLANQVCPANSVVTGISPTGTAVCTNIDSIIQTAVEAKLNQ